jgi:hypothetical protein
LVAGADERASMKAKKSYNYSAEPEDIRAWRRYAAPINQRIANKWKKGHSNEIKLQTISKPVTRPRDLVADAMTISAMEIR